MFFLGRTKNHYKMFVLYLFILHAFYIRKGLVVIYSYFHIFNCSYTIIYTIHEEEMCLANNIHAQRTVIVSLSTYVAKIGGSIIINFTMFFFYLLTDLVINNGLYLLEKLNLKNIKYKKKVT